MKTVDLMNNIQFSCLYFIDCQLTKAASPPFNISLNVLL